MDELPYKTINIIDPNTNNDVVLTPHNIYKYFNHVYCICPLNNTTGQMVLYRCDVMVLSNSLHFENLTLEQSDNVKDINLFGFTLDKFIVTFKIVNITILNIQKYFDSISGLNTFDRFYDVMILNQYFKHLPIRDESNNDYQKINNMIKILECSQYWSNKMNCLININKELKKRLFNVLQIKNCNDKKKNFDENYLHSNDSQTLLEYNIEIYKKTTNIYTQNDITTLLECLPVNMCNHLFMQLVVSKEYCHLVINNSEILTKMKDCIAAHIVEFKYRFSYAWLRFYIEELLDKNKITTNETYIFDINTASMLPVFFVNTTEPHSNPYMTLLMSRTQLNKWTNVGGINFNCYERRICNLTEFKERMNIFITGNKSIDIFSDINFKELNMGVTGSIMTACAQYNHPLMDLFTTNDMNTQYNRFFQEYYHASDIDIIISSASVFDFYDKFIKFYALLVVNILKNYNIEPELIDYIGTQSIYIFVDKDIIEKYIMPHTEQTYDYIIEHINELDNKKYLYDYSYELFKKNLHELLSSIPSDEHVKYFNMFKFNYVDVIIKFKNNGNTNPDYKNILVNYKFKINCAVLNHQIDIFQSRSSDIMNLVGNFHLPCVRAYYNGNVYMTPSFITAHMTYMNIDYRYFAGTNHPCEIINKYRMRGFGTWLNIKELKQYVEYTQNSKYWNTFYKNNETLGHLTLIHPVFYQKKHNTDNIGITEYNTSLPTRIIDETTYNLHIYGQAIIMSHQCAINKHTGMITPYQCE